MPTSRFSAKGLKNIKAFLEHECTWFLVRRGQRHREFRAVCCASPYLGRLSDSDDGRCLAVSLMLFRRSDGYVLSVVINGESLGPFACVGLGRHRLKVDGLTKAAEPLYVLRFISPLTVAQLAFVPYVSPVRSAAGSLGLDPLVVYHNACLVSVDEAREVMRRSRTEAVSSYSPSVPVSLFGLSGVGAWVLVEGSKLTLFCFALCYDLYTACCDRLFFPSLAKIYRDTVGCERDDCVSCADSQRHVDLTGAFLGCTPDRGLCLCYRPCGGVDDAPVRRRGFLPYLEIEDEAGDGRIERLFVRQPEGRKGLPATLSECLGARNARGLEVGLRDGSWQLIRLDSGLSRMIIMACPVLKRLVVEHV